MQLEIGTSILFLIEKRALGDAKSCSYPAMMMASGRYLSIDSVLLDDFFCTTFGTLLVCEDLLGDDFSWLSSFCRFFIVYCNSCCSCLKMKKNQPTN